MSNQLYTGALPLSAIRAAQAQRASQEGSQIETPGGAHDVKTLPLPVQERRFGTAEVPAEPDRPRMFTRRNSSPAPPNRGHPASLRDSRVHANRRRKLARRRQRGHPRMYDAPGSLRHLCARWRQRLGDYSDLPPGRIPLGIVAFPGGTALPGDDESASWVGPGAEYWQKQFHYSDVTKARRSVMAAVRESFEETGILLAGKDEQDVVERSSTPELMTWREAVADQDKSFAHFLCSSGLSIRADLLRPVARWQSPDFFLKRYDIAYFTTALPVGQDPKLLLGKGVGDWLNVRELLEARDTSELGDRIGQPNTVGRRLEELITPGVMCMLESLARAQTSVAWLSKRRRIEVRKAVLVSHNGACMLSFTEVEPPARPGRSSPEAWALCLKLEASRTGTPPRHVAKHV